MAIDQYVSVRVGEMGRIVKENGVVLDERQEHRYVMAIACKCILDHSTQQAFEVSHGRSEERKYVGNGFGDGFGGCLFRPSEGLVLDTYRQADGAVVVTGWACRNIEHLELELVPLALTASFKEQIREIVEADGRVRKKCR